MMVYDVNLIKYNICGLLISIKSCQYIAHRIAKDQLNILSNYDSIYLGIPKMEYGLILQ